MVVCIVVVSIMVSLISVMFRCVNGSWGIVYVSSVVIMVVVNVGVCLISGFGLLISWY